MIEISVIVATHNRLELLRRKLEALEAQTLPKSRFEVIVVADGCSDGTQDFLAQYKPSYPFKWLQTPGLHQAKARNRAIEQSESEILLLSDDDVVLEAGALSAHLEAQQRQPGVYLGAFSYENGHTWKPSYRGGQAHWAGLHGANTSFPAQTFQRVGGFWEGFDGYGGEDLELGYRLYKAGLRFGYLDTAKGVHAGEPSLPDLQKARSAGRQAMLAYKHHHDLALGLELGVHPALLALKMAVLPWLKGLLGHKGDYELAYASGAWQTRYEDPSAAKR